MNAKRRTASLATVALVATLGLAACERSETSARSEPATVGQKLDNAIDRTQQKIAEAGDKTAQTLNEAGDKTMQKLSEAGQKTGEALSTAGDKITEKTNEAVAAVKESTVGDTGKAVAGETARAMSDAAITASIKTDFLKDPDLSVLKIDVATKAGVVTLNGLTGDEPARQRAEKMASSIKGVKEVRNFLVVKRA